ncbi:MAG: hypothetical protein WC438_05665 [Candidatus Pacearchaeota archaeon]|jgi:hypothetical protein
MNISNKAQYLLYDLVECAENLGWQQDQGQGYDEQQIKMSKKVFEKAYKKIKNYIMRLEIYIKVLEKYFPIYSNKNLFNKRIYMDSGQCNGRDSYVLFRKQTNGNKIELLCNGNDIIDIDNLRNEGNNLNNGWNYFYLESNSIDRTI